MSGDIECLAEAVEEFFAQWQTAGASTAQTTHDAEGGIAHIAHRGTYAQTPRLTDSQAMGGEQKGKERERPNAETDWLALPASCKPTAAGIRNRILFNLARHLKTIYPHSKATDHLPLLKKWHAEHLHIIATKDWEETWADFRTAFRRVRFTDNETPLHLVFQEIDMAAPIPPELENLGYGPKGFIAFQLCKLLARNTDGSFFVSHRTLAPLIGCESPRTAGKILNDLVEDGCLELIEQGRMKTGGKHKASTYRFLGLPTGD